MDGAEPAEPDFAMLRASLHALQRATPTGRAGAEMARSGDPAAGWHGPFGQLLGTDGCAAWRRGSFAGHADPPAE